MLNRYRITTSIMLISMILCALAIYADVFIYKVYLTRDEYARYDPSMTYILLIIFATLYIIRILVDREIKRIKKNPDLSLSSDEELSDTMKNNDIIVKDGKINKL